MSLQAPDPPPPESNPAVLGRFIVVPGGAPGDPDDTAGEAEDAFVDYLARTLGASPNAFTTLVGADWLTRRRKENAMRIIREAESKIAEREDSAAQPVALAIALPLFEACLDEDRPEMVTLWADLLAAAMTPAKSPRVRADFVDIIKALEPMDVQLFDKLGRAGANRARIHAVNQEMIFRNADAFTVSADRLQALACLFRNSKEKLIQDHVTVELSSLGRLLHAVLN